MDAVVLHRTRTRIEAGLEHVRRSPRGRGTVEMIVARPAPGERDVLDVAELTVEDGLVGDGWAQRPTRTGPGGGPDPERQITLMNARYLDLIAGSRDRWSLAGDQLIVDLDLGADHLSPGDRLEAGSCVLEVTAPPHTGCAAFVQRFGRDALAVAADPATSDLHLRGIHARVVRSGSVRPDETIRRLT